MSIQPRGREPPVSSGLAQPQVWQKGTKELTSSVVKTQDVESGELGSIPFSSGCNSRVGRITSPAQPWNSSPGEVADSCLSSAGKALTGLQTSAFRDAWLSRAPGARWARGVQRVPGQAHECRVSWKVPAQHKRVPKHLDRRHLTVCFLKSNTVSPKLCYPHTTTENVLVNMLGKVYLPFYNPRSLQCTFAYIYKCQNGTLLHTALWLPFLSGTQEEHFRASS